MKKQSKKLRRVGLWGFVFVFIFSVIGNIFASVVSAQTENQPTFIDRLYVQYDGDTWGNPNPYNKDDGIGRQLGGFTYIRGWQFGDDIEIEEGADVVTGTAAPAGCSDYMQVTDLNGTPKAKVIFRNEDSFGECEVSRTQNDLTMRGTEKKFVNAYRRDANNIFAPAGVQSDNVGGCSPSTYDSFDLLLSGPSNFRRPPDPEDRPDNRLNRYYKIQSDNNLDDNIFMDTEGGVDATIILQIAGCGLVPGVERKFEQVVLANGGEAVSGEAGNCIPRIENPPSKGCPAGDSSDPTQSRNGGQGDTAEDECYDNAAEEGGLGWIICDLLRYGDNFTNELLVRVRDLLTLNERDYNDPDENLREAWSYFRNIASFALIIIGLVMVIGQATSKE